MYCFKIILVTVLFFVPTMRTHCLQWFPPNETFMKRIEQECALFAKTDASDFQAPRVDTLQGVIFARIKKIHSFKYLSLFRIYDQEGANQLQERCQKGESVLWYCSPRKKHHEPVALPRERAMMTDG